MYITIPPILSAILTGSLILGNLAAAEQAGQPERPHPQQVRAFTLNFFSTLPDYQTGDLITQQQVDKLLRAMLKKEWVVSNQDRQHLLNRILRNDAFLAKELNATKRSRHFLQKIKSYPGGIDRLDKIAQMPRGKRDVHAMIYNIPNGNDWIKGMTTTAYGRRMGNSISRWQKDAFNKKTGRLYTVEMLAPEMVRIVQLAQKTVQGQATR
ncbi:MAG: hypothetical protein GY768_02775 [Planctomycetaceae bacterium]|nr:hypothetical protein [Planctomycetaceae bacterium]